MGGSIQAVWASSRIRPATWEEALARTIRPSRESISRVELTAVLSSPLRRWISSTPAEQARSTDQAGGDAGGTCTYYSSRHTSHCVGFQCLTRQSRILLLLTLILCF